jgi:preprotein translocase subunit SecB
LRSCSTVGDVLGDREERRRLRCRNWKTHPVSAQLAGRFGLNIDAARGAIRRRFRDQTPAGGERRMVDQNGNGIAAATGAQPRLAVLVQYSKDFSFENPNAPRTLGSQQQSPNISVQINVNARQVGPADYEVNLVLEGGAGEGENMLFKFELNYAGVFRAENIPAEQIQPAIMIEGPRLLFPFARQIIADAVRNGGYPPLYIDPIDFQALFLQRVAAASAPAPAGAA